MDRVVIIRSSSDVRTPSAFSTKKTTTGAIMSFIVIVRKTFGRFTIDLKPFLPMSAPIYIRAKNLLVEPTSVTVFQAVLDG